MLVELTKKSLAVTRDFYTTENRRRDPVKGYPFKLSLRRLPALNLATVVAGM